MTSKPLKSRSGGRSARRASRDKSREIQAPYIQRNVPIYNILSDEGLEQLEFNADSILQEIGLDFHDEPAKQTLREAGADLDGDRVRFPRGMCRKLIQENAPKQFIQHARNPDRSVHIGGSNLVLAPAYGPPFIYNEDEGRRYATIEDFRNFVKLAYSSPALHHSGGTICEPVNLPVNKRHLDMVYSHIKYSDKPFMGSVTAPERAEDSVELCKRVFGENFVAENTVMINLINANSPLAFDATMLAAARVYARNNQACIIAPFVLSGAMSAVTVAGCTAQILAEAMAGMAYVQLVKPGAPVIFGNFSSSISMQSGAPTFGTPEPTRVLYCVAELARRLGVPLRGGGSLCGAKIPDAQAAYESANTFNATLMAGVNFVLHAAGWLEGGLTMGYEKFVMDADQIGMAAVSLKAIDLSENGQAMDAIREVGPGQHFLGCSHTQSNFETAFYRSSIADNNSFEQWQEEGGLSASQRANVIWKQILAGYEAPPLDPAIDEALLEFIAQRKAEFPDSNI